MKTISPMLRILPAAIFTLLLCPLSLSAETITRPTAQELYANALAKERESPALSYQTVKHTGDKTDTEKHYVLRRADGAHFLRIERTRVTPKTTYLTIDIANDTGYWTIIADYAIRMPNRNGESVAAVAEFRDELRQRKTEDASPDKFSGETVVRDDRSFAVITREISPEKQRQQIEVTQRVASGAEIANSNLPEGQANYRRVKELNALKQRVPARFQYVIDIERLLIVEERSFNADGGLLRQTIRQNLQLEGNLPADFFGVPAGCKKHFPASFFAYNSLGKEATLAQGAAWRAKTKPKKEQK